jgi:hypothetical protein
LQLLSENFPFACARQRPDLGTLGVAEALATTRALIAKAAKRHSPMILMRFM